MLQPNRDIPWLAVFAFILFVLFFQMLVKPVSFSTPQPQIAARPAVHFYLPPVPAWPVPSSTVIRPALSLVAIAG